MKTRNLCKGHLWDELEKFGKAKKSVIGFEVTQKNNELFYDEISFIYNRLILKILKAICNLLHGREQHTRGQEVFSARSARESLQVLAQDEVSQRRFRYSQAEQGHTRSQFSH